MNNAALRESWAVTLRHLAACRYYLPETLGTAEAVKAEHDCDHYLHHNELGLALEAAEDLGLSSDAPSEFWRELKMAAANMGLDELADRYAKLETS